MSASKRKGTAFETAVVTYLREHGFPTAERRALAGTLDRGDIAGIPDVAIECKAVQAITLAAFVDETERERRNADATYGITVIKRRQKSIGDAYAVMPLKKLVELLHEKDVA